VTPATLVGGPAPGAVLVDAPAVPSRRFAALRDAGPALLGYLGVRLVGLLMAYGYGSTHRPGTLARLGGLWDAGWYERVVRSGYGAGVGLGTGPVGMHGIPYSPRAFFPLLPWLAGGVREMLPVTPGTALVLVSSAASLAAAWGIFAVGRLSCGRRAGIVAAVLWGVLPLALLENTGYSEALFTALAAWCLYAVLTRRWYPAGLLCVAAGLSRPSAMALTAAVGLAATVELLRGLRRSRPVRSDANGPGLGGPLFAALVSPLGWGGYMLWTGWKVGSWNAYFQLQRAWATHFDGGGSTRAWFQRLLFPAHQGTLIPLADAVMALTLLGYLVLFALTLVHRQPLALRVFGAVLLAIDLGNASPAPPFARFLLPAFTLLFPLAVSLARLRSRGSLWVLLGTATLLSGCYGVHVLFLGAAPG
jgi:hypothetical protein